ncbi:MAG: hypothetical protein KF905_10315 [Flavobacteriales bacterium]|nr:hypothetical protein [Flavobacteriales bacterium]
METTFDEQRTRAAQIFIGEFGSKLGLACMLWDIAVTDGPRTVGLFLRAVNQDEPYEPMLTALARVKASFTFRGMHQRATQCQQMLYGLNLLWQDHGAEELFGFWLRQGWSTELRRRPSICSALGVRYPAGRSEDQHPPLWQLRTDLVRTYDMPIYRMMSQREYLEEFWRTGALRISTLSACKKHEGLQGDKREGDNALWSTRSDGTTIITGYEVGADAYILCGTVADTPENRREFKAERTGAIKITDPYRFGLAIGAAIPGVTHGQAGYCDYTETRIQHLEAGTPEALAHASIDFKDGKDLDKFRAAAPGDEIFLKTLEYQSQEEFRFAWYQSGPISNDFVDVISPAAWEFCEPVWFE